MSNKTVTTTAALIEILLAGAGAAGVTITATAGIYFVTVGGQTCSAKKLHDALAGAAVLAAADGGAK